jgi:membrane associated rhomboid family serine protease
MIFPIRTDSPLHSTPYMNWLLIAANVVVFFLQGVDRGITYHYALIPNHPTLPAFFTYAFLHDTSSRLPLHLFFNMLFLYIFGNNVNDKMGNIGYLAFYLAGGVMAGVCEVLTNHTSSPVIGASGAISAVTGAYLILFPRSTVTVFYFLFFIGRFELQSMWLILIFFAQDIFLSATPDSVAHMAHIGGTIFGASICLLLLIPQILPRDQYDVWALIQRWNKRRQYRDMVAKGYNPFELSPAAAARAGKRGADRNFDKIQTLRAQIADAVGRRDYVTATQQYLQLKELDPRQVLSRQAQLEVATQLHHDGQYPQAADAYELLLNTYPNVERSEQVELMVGLIYARYLQQYDRAKQHLSKAIDRMHGGRELDLAREELAQVELHLGNTAG